VRRESPQVSGFFAGDVYSGLDDRTIKSIVHDSPNIFDSQDLHGHLFDPEQKRAVLNCIEEVFNSV
jgi:hypothetical protein